MGLQLTMDPKTHSSWQANIKSSFEWHSLRGLELKKISSLMLFVLPDINARFMHIHQPMQYPSYTLEVENGYYKYHKKKLFRKTYNLLTILYTCVGYAVNKYMYSLQPCAHTTKNIILQSTKLEASLLGGAKPVRQTVSSQRPPKQKETDYHNQTNLNNIRPFLEDFPKKELRWEMAEKQSFNTNESKIGWCFKLVVSHPNTQWWSKHVGLGNHVHITNVNDQLTIG